MTGLPPPDPLHPSMSGDDADAQLVLEEIRKVSRDLRKRYDAAKFGQDPAARHALGQCLNAIRGVEARQVRGGLLSPLTVRVATPELMRRILAMAGLQWVPTAVTVADPAEPLPGLYIWVAWPVPGKEMYAPGLYAGIGKGAHGGVAGRLFREHRLINEKSYHGHGMAMGRTHAVPVAGPVTWADPRPDLAWLSEELDPECPGGRRDVCAGYKTRLKTP